jgi:hypothetical protein
MRKQRGQLPEDTAADAEANGGAMEADPKDPST